MQIKNILNDLNVLSQKNDRLNILNSISKLKDIINKEKQDLAIKFVKEMVILSPIKFLEKYVQDTYPEILVGLFAYLNQMLDSLDQMHQKVSSNNFNINELVNEIDNKNKEYERKFLVLDTYFKLFELFALVHFYYKANQQLIDHFILSKKKSLMFDKFDTLSLNDLEKIRQKIDLEIEHYSKKLNIKLS